MPLPGRYLTAPANESVVSVRLKTQTTAACGRPDWDETLNVGCYQVGLLQSTRWSSYPGIAVLQSTSFEHGGKSKMTLERCEASCRSTGAVAFAVFDLAKQCDCLSAVPEEDDAAPSFNCSITCGAAENQICGGDFTQTCSQLSLAADPPRCTPFKLYASVYRMMPPSFWGGAGGYHASLHCFPNTRRPLPASFRCSLQKARC